MVTISISGKNLMGLLRDILTASSFSKLHRAYFSHDLASQILGLLYKYCQEYMKREEFKVLCLLYGIQISGINDNGFQLHYQDISREVSLPFSEVKKFALMARQILQYSRDFHNELENLLSQCESLSTRSVLLIHMDQIIFQKEMVEA